MRLYGYEVPEMTMVISSLGSYFDANMALLNAEVRQQLFLSSRPIYTKVRDCPPALYGLHASVSHSLVADGRPGWTARCAIPSSSATSISAGTPGGKLHRDAGHGGRRGGQPVLCDSG